MVPKAKIGYFKQSLDALDSNKTVLENVMATSVQSEHTMRGILARLLIRREDVLKKAAVLSGGERVKLAFAKLFGSPANLLLLDELLTFWICLPSRLYKKWWWTMREPSCLFAMTDFY